ncbi:hypothetical protein XENTR_v10008647, partial [Xenopus tropicalis]
QQPLNASGIRPEPIESQCLARLSVASEASCGELGKYLVERPQYANEWVLLSAGSSFFLSLSQHTPSGQFHSLEVYNNSIAT